MIQPPISGRGFNEIILTSCVNYLLPESVRRCEIIRLRNQPPVSPHDY